MKITRFLDNLANYHFPLVFNPYRDVCSAADVDGAPSVRLSNLRLVLEASVRQRVDTIWVARDLGYRGGRRTGVALTDEVNLATLGALFGINLRRATRGPVVAERTAAMVWEIIKSFNKPVFLWNVFPFHPYEEAGEFTNRCHTRNERVTCRPILIELLDILQPSTVIAIGNDAEQGLADLGISASRVRHPSYGGKADFVAGLAELYGLQLKGDRQASLGF